MTDNDKLDKLLDLVDSLVHKTARDLEWNERHEEDHRYLREKIDAETYKKQFWLTVARNIATAGIWSTIVAVFGAIVFTLKSYF